IENFFAAAYAGQIKGPPKVLESPGHSFSDVARKVVSIINLASVRAIESMVGAPVHPLRFRANLYVEGWPAWHEFDLVDHTMAIGDIRLKVVKRIVRCAAINVDPDTAQRDLPIPQALQRRLGHAGCLLHPRSRVQCVEECAHEHTGTAGALRHSLRNGFTAYAALSPETNSSCLRRCRLDGSSIRLDQIRHRQLGTSHGCRDHTVLPYASAPYVLRAVLTHGKPRPANTFTRL